MDEYGVRYDRRMRDKDALDHMKQIWNPRTDSSKHIYKSIELNVNEKILPFHVKYPIFAEYYFLNKRNEYRLCSKYWNSIYQNRYKYRFADIFAAYRPKGECQLRFKVKCITKLNSVDVINSSGLRVISSKPVLVIEFGECVDAAVNANTMGKIIEDWRVWNKDEKRVYCFE